MDSIQLNSAHAIYAGSVRLQLPSPLLHPSMSKGTCSDKAIKRHYKADGPHTFPFAAQLRLLALGAFRSERLGSGVPGQHKAPAQDAAVTQGRLKETGPAPEPARELHHAGWQCSGLPREDAALPVLPKSQSGFSPDSQPCLSSIKVVQIQTAAWWFPSGTAQGQASAS